MAALDPKELLIRAAISALAGAVTTTVLVETAERAPGRRRRKKRKKSGAKKAGAKKKKSPAQREAERRADTPSRRASQEIQALPGPGMTVDEFIWSIKSAPSRMSTALGNVFNRSNEPSAIDEKTGKPVRKKDGFETLKEEAFFVAKTAVKDKIVEKTGMGGAISAVEKGADAVKRASADVAKKIKESVPDDVSEKVADAGRAISESGKKLGRAVKDGLPEDAEDVEELRHKLDEKVSGFSRWVEGPGAPNYRKNDDSASLAAGPKAAVFARDPDAPAAGQSDRVSRAAGAGTRKAAETRPLDDDVEQSGTVDGVAIALAGEGGHHLAVDEVMALRAQLDALVSGEGDLIGGDTSDEGEGSMHLVDEPAPRASSTLHTESKREPSQADEIFAPKEGTPKARPILRDDDDKREISKGAVKDKSRREQ
jgi:hypothetical protein